jgi:hypothetical protein
MKLKKRLLTLAVLIAAVGVFALLVVWFSYSSEPRYEGKRLTQWWDELEQPADDTDSEHEILARITNMVLGFGSKALPFYVESLNYRPSPDWYENLSRWVSSKSGHRLRLAERQDRTADASYCIQILGPAAAPIIPDLVILTSNKFSGDEVLRALAGIGPAAFPALSNLMATASDRDIRAKALQITGNMGPGAQPMTPLLHRWIRRYESTGTGGPLASLSLKLLTEIETNRSLVMPLLVKSLADTNTAPGAAFSLARTGADGMPLLFEAVTNQVRHICIAAVAALEMEITMPIGLKIPFDRISSRHDGRLSSFHYSTSLGQKIESVLLRYSAASNEQYRVAANLALDHFRAVGYPTNLVRSGATYSQPAAGNHE